MKFSRLFVFGFSLIILAAVSLFYTACNKKSTDPCSGINCLHGGACNSGVCVCPTGYSGTYCETADPCLGVVCQHGGTCSGGTCTCPVGYEGATCATLSKTKFVGAYTGSELCTVGTDNYTITITSNPSNDLKLIYSNLYNQSYTATCTVNSSNTFSFSGTDSGGGAVATFSGTGVLVGSTLTVTYTISSFSTSNTCTFTGTK